MNTLFVFYNHKKILYSISIIIKNKNTSIAFTYKSVRVNATYLCRNIFSGVNMFIGQPAHNDPPIQFPGSHPMGLLTVSRSLLGAANWRR